jgi:hypothetical protein
VEQHRRQLSGPLPLGGYFKVNDSLVTTRLVIRGKFFYLETGEPFTVIECSDFSLLKRFIMGDDITPVLQQRADLGFNMLRVWTLNTSVIPGGLEPKRVPNFYASLSAFLDLCSQYGLRVELMAFTQTQTLMPAL